MAKEASLGKPDKKRAATKDSKETEEEVRKITALKDVAADEAAGYNMREQIKETRPEEAALNAPRRKNQQTKKKDKKIGWY